VLMRLLRPCRALLCPINPIFKNSGQMLVDPMDLSLLLSRLEYSQQPSSRLIGRISVGSRVTIQHCRSKERLTITLVPPELADPENQRISFISAMGLALLGLRPGAVAMTQHGRKTEYWNIVAVNQQRIMRKN